MLKRKYLNVLNMYFDIFDDFLSAKADLEVLLSICSPVYIAENVKYASISKFKCGPVGQGHRHVWTKLSH